MGEPANGAFLRDARGSWQSGDAVRVAFVALLPLILLVVSVLGAFVEDNGGSWAGDVLTMWNLVGIFGSVVFVPLVAVSLIGAGVLRWNFYLGRWLATFGSWAIIVVAAVLVFGATADLVAPPEQRDPNSWAGPLSLFGTVLFVAPYVVMVAANVYVLVRLWWGR